MNAHKGRFRQGDISGCCLVEALRAQPFSTYTFFVGGSLLAKSSGHPAQIRRQKLSLSKQASSQGLCEAISAVFDLTNC
jgi:hypothetical protein